jgi:GAF domain-containing protein
VFGWQDCYDDPRFNQKIDRDTGYRTRTMLCMPIRDNYSNVVAVVQAINKLDGVFTLTDELLLTSVAIQSGNILRRAQLYEEEVCIFFLSISMHI